MTDSSDVDRTGRIFDRLDGRDERGEESTGSLALPMVPNAETDLGVTAADVESPTDE